MTVDPLAQLTGSTPTTPTVCERQVVEHEQLAGRQGYLNLDVPDAQAVVSEEREFGGQAVELKPTEKARIELHAGKLR